MVLLSRETNGVFAIAPTPFAADGAVDYSSLDKLVDYYHSTGVTGLTVLGQMGEASKLDQAEASAVAARFLTRTQLPVIVGVSAPGFAAMKALADEVMAAGAAGVMVAPPNTLRTDDQIHAYYEGAAAAIGDEVPIVVQDYPLSFSVVMSVPVIARIAREIPNCVMLKHEDWPGLEKISALRRLEAAGETPRMSIMCGNGGLFLDFETERGADGAMTGYCFPEMLVEVVAHAAAGRRAESHDIFDAHLPLVRYEQQPGSGLAVRKHVMMRRGLLATDILRAPASRLSKVAEAEIDYLLTRLARRIGRVDLVD